MPKHLCLIELHPTCQAGKDVVEKLTYKDIEQILTAKFHTEGPRGPLDREELPPVKIERLTLSLCTSKTSEKAKEEAEPTELRYVKVKFATGLRSELITERLAAENLPGGKFESFNITILLDDVYMSVTRLYKISKGKVVVGKVITTHFYQTLSEGDFWSWCDYKNVNIVKSLMVPSIAKAEDPFYKIGEFLEENDLMGVWGKDLITHFVEKEMSFLANSKRLHQLVADYLKISLTELETSPEKFDTRLLLTTYEKAYGYYFEEDDNTFSGSNDVQGRRYIARSEEPFPFEKFN